jgi:hypothetical protein
LREFKRRRVHIAVVLDRVRSDFGHCVHGGYHRGNRRRNSGRIRRRTED